MLLAIDIGNTNLVIGCIENDKILFKARIAYVAYWMEHSVAGVLGYFGVFVLIFAVIWGIQFVIGKWNVKKMNEKISEEKQN